MKSELFIQTDLYKIHCEQEPKRDDGDHFMNR